MGVPLHERKARFDRAVLTLKRETTRNSAESWHRPAGGAMQPKAVTLPHVSILDKKDQYDRV